MGIVSDVQQEVASALEQIRHPGQRPMIVAISGGVDSQVLAHALTTVTSESGPTLLAVHVDHGLRESSASDAERVGEVCSRLNLEYEIKRVDVDAWDAELRQGTESAARAARYASLATAAIGAGSDTIATGHTLDDQAETVLLRLMSGSGLEGMGGMGRISRRSVSLDPGGENHSRVAIFRPMLNLRRTEIDAYARECALIPIEDETNESLEFRRNAIRKTVLPAMEKIEPGTLDAINRTTRLLRDDANFIADTVDETFDDVVAERSGVWMIERQQFRVAYQAIQRRILYRVIEPLLRAGTRLGLERIEALRQASVDGRSGTVIELAEDLIGYIDYDRVAIGRAESLEDDLRRLSWIPQVTPGAEIPLRGNISVALDNGWRVLGEAPADDGWVLRTRRDGDRTRNERGREVKLQDWLVDRKVPRYVRDWLPVVARESEVRWIIGLDITEFKDPANDVHLHLELDTEPTTA